MLKAGLNNTGVRLLCFEVSRLAESVNTEFRVLIIAGRWSLAT